MTQRQDSEAGGWLTTLEEVDPDVLEEEVEVYLPGVSHNTGKTTTWYQTVIVDESDMEGIAWWSFLQDCLRIHGGLAQIWQDTGS